MSQQTPHILVVDDSREVREPLAKYLRGHAMRVTAAASAAAAREALRTQAIDLIVLDVTMPGEDGFSFFRKLRSANGVPVLFLTARGEEADRVAGIELGADDYVVKPFSPRELVARINAILRRAQAALPARPANGRIAFEGWVLDTARRELVDRQGVSVALSGGEYRLLLALAERPNLTLSREQLLDLARGREGTGLDRAVDNAIMRLRRKLERDPASPRIIKTVRSGGYVFAAETTSA